MIKITISVKYRPSLHNNFNKYDAQALSYSYMLYFLCGIGCGCIIPFSDLAWNG